MIQNYIHQDADRTEHKLWKLMKDNKLKKKDLVRGAQLNHHYMAKLGHSEPVHMDGLIRLCQVFHCDIGDNGQSVTFSEFLFHTQQLQNAFNNYTFSNNRAITKSMLTWWAFQNPGQELLSLENVLEIEHIYARNRHEKDHTLSNPRHVEALGNKALLEKRISIRTSDYRFTDKVKYYKGFENVRKQMKEGTKIKELTDLADSIPDFTEADIVQRTSKIIFGLIEFMYNNGLLSEE